MTIDEAIKKLLDEAKQHDKWADNYVRMDYYSEATPPEVRRQHAKECRQLAEWLEELKEAKRLLKSATNVLNMFIPCDEDYNCSECIKQRQNCDYDDSFKWRYADEALKLLNDEK